MSDVHIVSVPKLYENMDEATIGPWQVELGQDVRKGDVLVELITDKTVAEFESPAEGRILALYAPEKSTVPIGYRIAAIGPAGAQAPDVKAENDALLREHSSAADVLAAVAAERQPEEAMAPARPTFRAAPAARALAKKYDIDLALVAAESDKEILHRKDVEEYLARHAEPPRQAAPESAAPSGTGSQSLAGKVALVTGASGGIGQAIARRLARDGAALALHANRNVDAVNALAEELRSTGATVLVRQADLAEPDQVKTMIESVATELGGLHILVNNAGVLADSVVSFMTDDHWHRALTVNLTAAFYTTRSAAMIMARQRFGRIVNITSDAGRLGSANRSNYAAAKEGLVGFTRSVAREMAGLGVRVNAVSPGFVETAMVAGIPDVRRRELEKSIPVRRFGRPEEVAEVVAFLCQPTLDYMTGQVLFVDGGLFMG